ncbi:MAG: cytochrome C oxidase subunit IV family protein [Gemmataceae bacterium]
MAEHSEHAHAHHGPSVVAYLAVFVALSVFTIISFVVNGAVTADEPSLTQVQGFAIILGVAVIKALLVAFIFMHLKWDWGYVYFMIVPTMVLGVLMLFVLLPDIVLAWHMK